MADGGEGTLDAFAAAVPGAVRMPGHRAAAPRRPVDASWLRLRRCRRAGGTAVVELAMTSGITLLDPLAAARCAHARLRRGDRRGARRRGRRLLLAHRRQRVDRRRRRGARGARRAIPRRVRCARCGSATAASARSPGRPLGPARAAARRRASILGDVDNPLLGGAAPPPCSGRRRGRMPTSSRCSSRTSRGSRGVVPGSRARGARRRRRRRHRVRAARLGRRRWPGARRGRRRVGLDAALARADLVVTGEGRFDGQSEAGKAPTEVAARAAAAGVRSRSSQGRSRRRPSRFATSVSLSDLAGDSAAAMAEPVRWLELAGAGWPASAKAWPNAADVTLRAPRSAR